jgi:hypothetical protein
MLPERAFSPRLGRGFGGGGMTLEGGKGGGGAPAPSSQTVTQTNIPEYARPYVERMMGKSEALTDIEANPYQAYGGQRISDFSPLQRQAFENVAGQQTAGQLGAATGLAGAAGLASLGAGADYRNMATNPYATQAYMSPYMQNVVNVQKDEAFRDAQIRNLGSNLGSARQGTYGGARQALAEQERNRNLQTQLGQIQAGGSQKAFEAAQQAQQFGTSAGLQGYGQALQGAGALGQLGQTQFGQQQAINQAQQNVGAIQQAQAQQGLDIAYQDFLKQKNYPYQQLAFQSDMLRGLPLSQAAQQQYTAPPSPVSQLGGLGMSALGIYGMSGGFKGATGGLPKDFKRYAEGGLAYAEGGDIKTMSTEQLQALLDSPNLSPMEVALIEKQLMLRRRMEMNPETDQIMNSAMRSGIGSISTGDMVPEQMAGGGIVAFQAGGKSGVDAIKTASESRQSYRDQLEREVLESMKRLKTEDPFKESRAQDEQIRAQIAESRKVSPYEALTMAGLRTMAGTSPYALANLGAGGEEGLKTFGRSKRGEAELQKQLLQQGVEREKSQFGRQTQLLGAQQTALGQLYGKEAEIERAKAARATAGATQAGTLYNQLSNQYMTAVSREMETLRKRYKDQFNMDKTETELESEAVANVTRRLPPQARKTLFGDQVIPDGTPAPAAAPATAPAGGKKSFPKPSGAAVKQLRDSDNPTTRGQFDAIFGPGAAQRALGK